MELLSTFNRDQQKEAGVSVEMKPDKYRYDCPYCGFEIEEKVTSSVIDWDEIHNGIEYAFCPRCEETFHVFIEDYV